VAGYLLQFTLEEFTYASVIVGPLSIGLGLILRALVKTGYSAWPESATP